MQYGYREKNNILNTDIIYIIHFTSSSLLSDKNNASRTPNTFFRKIDLFFVSGRFQNFAPQNNISLRLYTHAKILVFNSDYYTPAMLGLKTDQEVLGELVKAKVPAVWQAMNQHNVMWSLVVSRWFICLYIDVLPMEVRKKLCRTFKQADYKYSCKSI